MPSSSARQASMSSPHVLVVDDDADVLDMLRRYFSGQGFAVSTAADGRSMRDVLAKESIDIVLLDLGLPGEDGFELTRYLRTSWNGAIIIVTGRGESVDRVVGLELGADDYVTKPFDLRELLARMRSVLRRVPAVPTPAAAEAGDEAPFRFAGFRLDPRTRSLVDEHGNEVALTAGEYELLRVFLDDPNRILSRDDLMERIHGRESGPFDRAIDVKIGRLRRKIEEDPEHPAMIKSVRGAGYLFTPHVRRE